MVKESCPIRPTGGGWFPYFIRPLILAWTAFSLQSIWLAMFLVVCLYRVIKKDGRDLRLL